VPPAADVGTKTPTGADAVPSARAPLRSSTGPSALLGACDGAVIGSPLPAECRPRVELKTARGTVLTNVPVSWAIGSGGGVTAVDDPVTRACGPFGTTTSTTTNANGRAGACWTLGMNAVVNTLVATPSVGGDVPAGASFTPASKTFTATALQAASSVSVSCGAASYAYTGVAQTPCTAVATGFGGLNLVLTDLSYSNNTNAGTALATATFAGDANHTASTATGTFEITKVSSTTTVSCGGPYTYTGAAQVPCMAVATGAGGLSQVLTGLSYTNNTNAGAASASATFAGDANHTASTGTAAFEITKAPSTVTVSCGGPYTYTGLAQTPCTAAATGAGDLNLGLTAFTYGSNTDVGTASATVTFDGDANHLAATGTGGFVIAPATPVLKWPAPLAITLGTPLGATQLNATASYLAFDPLPGTFVYAPTSGSVLPAGANALSVLFTPASTNFTTARASTSLDVRYVQVGCFSTPVYSEMPVSKSYQRKGSNVPIKCTLTNAQGVGVMTAKGDLLVQDMGTVFGSPAAPYPKTAFAGTDVFKVSTSGNFAYGLDTSPAAFVSGHYYFVTAHWNDGSTTTGWFYIK
jgi:hypothetical protein